MVVERQLLGEGTSRLSLGREAFVSKVWEWKDHSGNTITEQMRRIGTSIDWSRARFTLDKGLSEAVQEVFIRLYDEGLIYRGKRLVNWDPKLHTALSDLEVTNQEEAGHLWHIRYPLVHKDKAEYLIVATTRPETLLGDTAVAVNPNDERYKHLIGQTITLPLTERIIPIIADEYVEMEFGTGCVKITPAHDFNDYEIGKRHDLEMINIFTPNAELNENAPSIYQGLNRFEARKRIVADLKEQGLLEKVEDYIVKTPRGDRSGDVLEPYLTDQWYINTKPLAAPAMEAVKTGEIQFVPENWSKTYFEWMENIQDWCISRQLWWGHRIPAWYDEDNAIFVGKDEADVRKKYKLKPEHVLKQDEDVLDTWFSSALWPFSTLGWPEKTKDLETFYPTQVLVTGFDILFFWVARMIMMGLKFTGKVPFKTVYVHGLIQDADGQKMSKSKGNIIDPLDLIEGIDLEDLIKKRTTGLMQPGRAKEIEVATRKHFPNGIAAFGTDALRFTLCALATNGRHIRYDFHRTESYRNFCNKIWNAARYVLMNTQDQDLGSDVSNRIFSVADQWIWSELQTLKAQVHQHLNEYRFDLLASQLYEFIWNVYCDWYLELSKPVLNQPEFTAAQKAGTRYTLLGVLDVLLKLLHPIMPFITEEIWQQVRPLLYPSLSDSDYLIYQSFPKVNEPLINPKATKIVTWIQGFITGVRNIRGEMNISPSKVLSVLCQQGSTEEQAYLNEYGAFLKSLAKLDSITYLNSDATPPICATALAGEMEILIPMADLIDKEAESKRLTKEIEKMMSEQAKIKTKLDNKNYLEKAKPDLIALDRARLSETEAKTQKLQAQLDKILSS
jgi:valyl-tRNA synthetase